MQIMGLRKEYGNSLANLRPFKYKKGERLINPPHINSKNIILH